MPIENISDTARWVAAYRAEESARPDALFHDPFAAALAGDRGRQLGEHLRGGSGMTWIMAVRTAVLDEMVLNAIHRDRVDVVVNLACGLDTRAFRMDLPASLQWVDADFKGILDYREQVMQGAKPRCAHVYERVDLADDEARRAFLLRSTAGKRKALVVTEGLLMYLPEVAVRGIADDLYRTSPVRYWAMDLLGPLMLRGLQIAWNRKLAEGDARMVFGPAEGTGFFRPHGWHEAEVRPYVDEGARLKRGLGPRVWKHTQRFLVPPIRNQLRGLAGIVRLERS